MNCSSWQDSDWISSKKMTASYTNWVAAKTDVCLQTHRPDPEMMTSFLTILYEDLLMVGRSMSKPLCMRACSKASRPKSTPTGTGPPLAVRLFPSMLLRCNSYLREVLMFLERVPGAAATSQGRGKQQGGRGRRERWQGGQERNKLDSSPMCK